MKTNMQSTLIVIGFVLSTVVISLQGEKIERLSEQVDRLEKARLPEATTPHKG